MNNAIIITDKHLNYFLKNLKGASIGTLWTEVNPITFNLKTMFFDERKECFFALLERLITTNHVVLTKDGQPAANLLMLRLMFPTNQWEMGNGASNGFWFESDNCPWNIKWVNP